MALIESAYRGESSRAGWTTEADLLSGPRTDDLEVRGLIEGMSTRFVLAEASATGTLLGCVLVKDERDCAYVGMFSVVPTEQAQGLGRALLTEAERIARDELGRVVVRMTVIAQRSELLAWYLRRGYVLTGKREPFPYAQLSAGDPLRDDLVFEVLEKRIA